MTYTCGLGGSRSSNRLSYDTKTLFKDPLMLIEFTNTLCDFSRMLWEFWN